MAFLKKTWENAPSEETPITAEELNRMEQGIYDSADGSIYATNHISMGRRDDTSVANNSIAYGANAEASGWGATSIGSATTASGYLSFAIGFNTRATETYAYAEGEQTVASGHGSHAEGYNTNASASCSHSEGEQTVASGYCSHAEGYHTEAKGSYQHVLGQYNEVPESYWDYAVIVGGGTEESRKNIVTVDWSGNAIISGDITNGNGVSLDSLSALIAELNSKIDSIIGSETESEGV